MEIGTRGPTNAIYGTYGNGIIQRSISAQKTWCIEQVYEILPQDIKRQERKELEKINTFKAKNSLSLHYSRVHQNGPFYIEFMDYMDTTLSMICTIMGDYLIPIYIQVGSSFSPNIYQESVTYIKIVSQELVFTRFLKMEYPPTCKSIFLHTSHLFFSLS